MTLITGPLITNYLALRVENTEKSRTRTTTSTRTISTSALILIV